MRLTTQFSTRHCRTIISPLKAGGSQSHLRTRCMQLLLVCLGIRPSFTPHRYSQCLKAKIISALLWRAGDLRFPEFTAALLLAGDRQRQRRTLGKQLCEPDLSQRPHSFHHQHVVRKCQTCAGDNFVQSFFAKPCKTLQPKTQDHSISLNAYLS